MRKVFWVFVVFFILLFSAYAKEPFNSSPEGYDNYIFSRDYREEVMKDYESSSKKAAIFSVYLAILGLLSVLAIKFMKRKIG